MNVRFSDGLWLNEPSDWRADGSALIMTTDEKTDFWRTTHYGFVRDTGHFLGFATTGNFTAQVRVEGRFTELYDQAGLMIRLDERRWVKTGIEFTDHRRFLSTVVTDGNSDWSVSQPFDDLESFYIRATLKDGALRVQASKDGTVWPLLRLAPFPQSSACLVGPMACTPERSGLRVVFSDFTIGPAIGTGLHDLS